MKLNWKHTAGAFALSVALLGMSAIGPVGAAAKRPPRVHPPIIMIPMPTKTETPEDPKPSEGTPEAERGIKDQGVKGCNGCGVTGREAAPGTGEAPAEGGPGGGPRVDAQGAGDPKVTEKKKSRPKERDDPIYSNRTSLLPVLGGAAALAALVVAVSSGGDDAPTSP